jgi:hypothetical protein
MSTYLNELIQSLETEAVEERAHLRALERHGGRRSRFTDGALRRTLQRIEVLKKLQRSEATARRSRRRSSSVGSHLQ